MKRLIAILGLGQRGQSIVEVLLAVTVLAVTTQAVTLVIRTAARQNVANRNKVMATQKAVQMLEELRSLVLDEVAKIDLLDSYNDGFSGSNPIYRYTLTTKRDITHPGGTPISDATDFQSATDPLSDNPISKRGFSFVRHIDVLPNTVSGDNNSRKVWVRVYEAATNSGAAAATNPQPNSGKLRPLAEAFAIIRSLGRSDQPNQVMDIYLIALENIPGWWSRTSNLIPLMRSAVVSLQARNPGLKVRPHWISRMSYGRDMEYTPELNKSVVATDNAAFKQAYVYPGLVDYDDIQDDYYLASHFSGRLNQDGAMSHLLGYGASQAYAMADQYNHAVRYPDEERLYEAHRVVALNQGSGAQPPEISYRMLLERLNRGDHNYLNSVIINLHGEMLPVPPLRNVSDAAKDPAYYWGGRGGGLPDRAWRAVTHPERLWYKSDGSMGNPALRVYAYDMNPSADVASPKTDGTWQAYEDDLVDTITLFVPGASVGNLAKVTRYGGNSRVGYHRQHFDSGNWVVQSSTQLQSRPLETASTWVADDYTPPGRLPGLRIRLYGTTPTARVCANCALVP